MPISDPKQNTHRWWGTLTVDEDTEIVNGGKLAVDTLCVFVKTSNDSHYLSQGTYIKKLSILKARGDAAASIRSKVSEDVADLATDLDFPDSLPIVEILEIDYSRTSALTKALNAYTKKLFDDDAWMDSAGSIGKERIRIGSRMKGLQK